jgi:hypothetical protein
MEPRIERNHMRYYTVLSKSPQVESPQVEPPQVTAESEVETQSRTYASGEPIPESLPDSYGMAQNCYNCFAYDSTIEFCSAYNATVRPNYWCAAWKGN